MEFNKMQRILSQDNPIKINLHIAALEGDTKAVRSKINDYKEINEKNTKGNTPLHCALQGMQSGKKKADFIELIKILLIGHADTAIENNEKLSPFIFAARNSMLTPLRLMFEYEAMNASPKNQMFLNELKPNDAIDFFLLLLKLDIEIGTSLNIALQAASEKSRAAFFEAIILCFFDENKKEVAGKLLRHIDLDSKSKFYKTNSLFYRVFYRVYDTKGKNPEEILNNKIKLLSVIINDKASNTFEIALYEKFKGVLPEAAKKQIQDIIHPTESKKSDTFVPSQHKTGSEHKEEKKEVINKLLPLIEKNDYGSLMNYIVRMSPSEIESDVDSLCFAIRYQSDKDTPDLAIINSMINGGFSPTKIFKNGKSALHLAAECKSSAVLSSLLKNKEAKQSIDQLSEDGLSPLHIAARNGSLKNSVILLKSHANPFVLTADKKTFLELYAEKNDVAVLLHQPKLNLNLFEKPISVEENKHTIHSQSITHFLMDQYCEEKVVNKNIEKTLLAIAQIYPNEFYKQFKRKEEQFATKVSFCGMAEKPIALHKQKRICELVQKTEINFLNTKRRFHNRLFTSRLGSSLKKRIQGIDAELKTCPKEEKEVKHSLSLN